MDISQLIYLHCLDSTSNSGKARLFREWFPGMLTPGFTGSFASHADVQLVPVPIIVIHGTLDTVIQLEPVRAIAQKFFTDLTYHIVEDDHRLHKTVHELDWKSILQ